MLGYRLSALAGCGIGIILLQYLDTSDAEAKPYHKYSIHFKKY